MFYKGDERSERSQKNQINTNGFLKETDCTAAAIAPENRAKASSDIKQHIHERGKAGKKNVFVCPEEERNFQHEE